MPLISDSTPATPNAYLSSKVSRSKGWVIVCNFAFCPDKVDGFLHVPEHTDGHYLRPAVTQVFFTGYTANVIDDKAELYQFLLQYRELA